MKKRFIFTALIAMFAMLLAFQIGVGAESKFSEYDLKPFGTVRISADWSAESHEYEQDMVEYLFHDEYLFERFRIMRLMSIFVEPGDFSESYLHDLNLEAIEETLSENLINLFDIDAEFESAVLSYGNYDLIASTVPSKFFGGLSMPTIVYIIFVKDNSLVVITIIDEYFYMVEDFDIYNTAIGDLIGIEDGVNFMEAVFDSINN